MASSISRVSPRAIYTYIDKYVVGQEDAKRTIANAMFLHYVRFLQSFHDENKSMIKKSNVLLTGPSGSGKTYLVRRAAEALRHLSPYDGLAPVLEVDCNTLSSAGWSGNDIEDVLETHYMDYGKNEAAFSSSVVFLDEIDKLCIPAVGTGGTDHNKNTQYGLLKIVEGYAVYLPKLKRQVDTSKMLFVFAGNFPQLRRQRDEDLRPALGFYSHDARIGGDDTDIKSLHLELEEAGMVTQLAGRISFVDETELLTKDQLEHALLFAEDSIFQQYKSTWHFMGEEPFELTDSEISEIIDFCHDNKVGVRGLQAAIDNLLKDRIFNLSFAPRAWDDSEEDEEYKQEDDNTDEESDEE